MYGSIFCSVTRKPRASSSAPIEAAARPLPRDDTTPPVTKMYFGANSSSFRDPLSDVRFFHGPAREPPVEPCVPHLGQDARHGRSARDPERDDVVAAQGYDARIEAGEPVNEVADLAVAGEPEPRELERRGAAQRAPRRRRARARGRPAARPRTRAS